MTTRKDKAAKKRQQQVQKAQDAAVAKRRIQVENYDRMNSSQDELAGRSESVVKFLDELEKEGISFCTLALSKDRPPPGKSVLRTHVVGAAAAERNITRE